MNFALTLGKETISLLNTVKAFKIGKFEMIQKWYVKNEEEIRALEGTKGKVLQLAALKATQQRLLADMEIIKAASVHEGQGPIWNTKVYNNLLNRNVVVTQEISERDKLNDLINSIDPKVTTLYIRDYLKAQDSQVLSRFLKPIISEHNLDLIEVKTQ